MPSKIWPGIGRCIYCGDATSSLSDEHIIPFGLGGTDVLQRASCSACATETGRFEGVCQRFIFGHIRVRMGLPTRQKKERPTKLPFSVTMADGSHDTLSLEVNDHPTTFALFQFEPARILLGLPEFQPQTFQTKIWLGGLTPDELKFVARRYGGKGFVAGRFSPLPFARMLAKVAYAHAVALHGIDGFEPLLPRLITGKPSGWGHFVGSNFDALEAEPVLHTVGLELKHVYGNVLLVAFVRLFACYGAPRYHVALGVVPKDSALRLKVHDQLRPPR